MMIGEARILIHRTVSRLSQTLLCLPRIEVVTYVKIPLDSNLFYAAQFRHDNLYNFDDAGNISRRKIEEDSNPSRYYIAYGIYQAVNNLNYYLYKDERKDSVLNKLIHSTPEEDNEHINIYNLDVYNLDVIKFTSFPDIYWNLTYDDFILDVKRKCVLNEDKCILAVFKNVPLDRFFEKSTLEKINTNPSFGRNVYKLV